MTAPPSLRPWAPMPSSSRDHRTSTRPKLPPNRSRNGRNPPESTHDRLPVDLPARRTLGRRPSGQSSGCGTSSGRHHTDRPIPRNGNVAWPTSSAVSVDGASAFGTPLGAARPGTHPETSRARDSSRTRILRARTRGCASGRPRRATGDSRTVADLPAAVVHSFETDRSTSAAGRQTGRRDSTPSPSEPKEPPCMQNAVVAVTLPPCRP
jgi:hypothetical protein